jgi:tetratricopeptide (TPR) repeat protein
MKRIIMLVTLLVPVVAFASGGGGGGFSGSESPSSLKEIKKKVDDKKYSEAIGMLNRYTAKDGSSADAYTYLGFCYRKSGRLPEAFKAYDRALKLDPKHLGAHEYLGEAYLVNRQPEKAKETLSRLKGICRSCEESRDLERAINSYRN